MQAAKDEHIMYAHTYILFILIFHRIKFSSPFANCCIFIFIVYGYFSDENYSISCSTSIFCLFSETFWKLFCSGSTYGTQYSAYMMNDGVSLILGNNHFSMPHPHFQKVMKEQHNFNFQLSLCLFVPKCWLPTRAERNLIIHSQSQRVVNEESYHVGEKE